MTEKQDLTGTDDAPTRSRIVFYLLVDRSGSMRSVESTLNGILDRILEDLYENDGFATSGFFGLIAFSEEPEIVLPVQRIGPDTKLSHVECGGATNVEKALDRLREDIENVVAQNAAEDFYTHRPVVCVLTDGHANRGNTTAALRRLENSAPRPRVLAFGLGEADERLLGLLATELAWTFTETTPESLRDNLERFSSVFVGTLIGTVTATDGEVHAVTPDHGHAVPMIPLRSTS